MSTTFYNPQTITHLSARNILDDAYAAVGITPPSRVDAITAILAAEPEPHEILAKYADKSLDGNQDARKLTEEALAAWQRAHTVESFRTSYDRVVDALAMERIADLRAGALKAISKPFAKLTTRLTQVAATLDKDAPLDRARSFEQDTSSELKEAELILTQLSSYAITGEPTITGAAARLLAIVTIPDVVQEEITRTTTGSTFVIPNDPNSKQRNIVRAMLRDADRDLDKTIIDIARGRWDNITFALADDDEMTRRATAHHNATMRKPAQDRNTDNLVRVL